MPGAARRRAAGTSTKRKLGSRTGHTMAAPNASDPIAGARNVEGLTLPDVVQVALDAYEMNREFTVGLNQSA